MLPGSPIGAVLPSVNISAEELESELDAIASDSDSIFANLTNDLTDSYASINQDVAGITANVAGAIANDIDAIDALKSKLANKVLTNAENTLSEAYGKIIDLGFNLPTMDDVRYGLASSDYMGSMTGQSAGNTSPESISPISQPSVSGNYDDVIWTPFVHPGTPQLPVGGGTSNPVSSCPDFRRLYGYSQIGETLPIAPAGTAPAFLTHPFNNPQPFGTAGVCRYALTATNIPTILGGPTTHWIIPSDMIPAWNPATGELRAMRSLSGGFVWYPCIALHSCRAGTQPQIDPTLPTLPPFDPDFTPPVVCPVVPPVVVPPVGTCPVPPTFTCGPTYGWNVPPLNADEVDFCKRMETAPIDWEGVDANIASIIMMASTSTAPTGIAGSILNALTGSPIPAIPGMVNRLAQWLTKVLKDISVAPNCDNARLAPLAAVNAAVQFIEKWTGAVLPQIAVPIKHAANSVCQWSVPTPGEADSMFLNDTIDKARWECYQKADGNFVSDFERLLSAKRVKPDPLQVSQLFRRKQLSEDDYKKRMRANGVLKSEDVTDIYNLTQSWPGISDVTRFLVRDIADKDLVDKFGMHDDFDKKYGGRLIDYADAVGVPKELMKDYWAAHWHIPSFTMLTEMLHRLRPGVVNEDIQVTRDDVYDALKQDDWLPYWARRMIEVSYKPVARTDAVRAYMIHSIEDEELLGHHLDVGYNEKAANFYVKYYKRRRELSDARASGLPSIRALTRQYATCLITEQEYRDSVAKLALSEEHEAEMLAAGRLAVKIEDRKLSVNQVKRPFELGLIDYNEATDSLSGTDIDPRCVRALIDAWALKQLRRSKFLSVGQLCKMRERGIISNADHVRALVRNNWDKEDAIRIATECDLTVSEKQAARARREADRAQRIREKLARDNAKRLKLEACGPPTCPANTPGGMIDPPNFVPG